MTHVLYKLHLQRFLSDYLMLTAAMTRTASAVTHRCSAGALAAAGVDVTQVSLHQARKVTPEDVQNATHVICLQDSHRQNLVGMLPAASEKAVLLNVCDVASVECAAVCFSIVLLSWLYTSHNGFVHFF